MAPVKSVSSRVTGQSIGSETGYESRQTSKRKQCCCSLRWKLPDRAQSFVFSSQIVTD